MEITTIGLDLAKRIFQVHGLDAAGRVVVRKSLRRAQTLGFFAKLPSETTKANRDACSNDGHAEVWFKESQHPPSPDSLGLVLWTSGEGIYSPRRRSRFRHSAELSAYLPHTGTTSHAGLIAHARRSQAELSILKRNLNG
jgi:hypothetical protein